MKYILCLLALSYSETPTTHETLEPLISFRAGSKRRRSGDSQDSTDSETFYDVIYIQFKYTLPVLISNSSQAFSMVLGFMVDSIWVQDSNCSLCKSFSSKYSSSYIYNTSISYTDFHKNLRFKGFSYIGTISILQYQASHSIISANYYYDPYNSTNDGIFGLGSDSNSIVYKIFEQGVISSPKYSLHCQDISAPFLILGDVNFDALNLTVENSIVLDYKEELNGVFTYDNMSFESYPVEFSSVNSYIIGPSEIVYRFYSDLIDGYGCYSFDESIFCECEYEYPNVTFWISGYEILVYSDSYLIAMGSQCMVYIFPGDYWILGKPFLTSMFATVDLAQHTMTFSEVSIIDRTPPGSFETSFGWEILLYIFVISIFIYLLAIGTYQLIKSKIESQLDVKMLRDKYERILLKNS
ncbi:hypothetical protein SteCoe_3819 [Stentor coeruleus]|uniref:Peptidase A1 domain-containing protein n=1 Tax=Stentor coeruleus TaxID=5963 RepID=A0A1R2CW95_9CILI|nr:hypothetical protein SteCoe_3819 [Stentor coeruleus]